MAIQDGNGFGNNLPDIDPFNTSMQAANEIATYRLPNSNYRLECQEKAS
jgi:hypothetical protein